jgi:hypothetical protein
MYINTILAISKKVILNHISWDVVKYFLVESVKYNRVLIN